MKFKLYLGLLMLVISITSNAQIITLSGKVTNVKTGEAVPGASVLSGAFGTSADDNGKFVFYVQQAIIEESGITVSSIGYQTTHLTNITDDYNITMTPVMQELKAVNILSDAEYIVQKAYRQIRDNYVNENFTITGVQRMVHTVKDTFGYQYYYWNNAKTKMYMSPYADTPLVANVALMEKDEKRVNDPKALRIPFMNGYKVPLNHDYVHTRALMLQGNAAKYSYKLNRKEMIDGRKVYVVNFFSKFNDANAGILYIDTATFAFVKVLHTKYNVKTPRAIDLDKVTVAIQYRVHNDKWVLDAVKYNSVTDHKGYDVERAEEFQAAVVTTDHAVQIPANAIIIYRAIDDNVKPYNGFSAADKKIPKEVLKLVDGSFSKINIPDIVDTAH